MVHAIMQSGCNVQVSVYRLPLCQQPLLKWEIGVVRKSIALWVYMKLLCTLGQRMAVAVDTASSIAAKGAHRTAHIIRTHCKDAAHRLPPLA